MTRLLNPNNDGLVYRQDYLLNIPTLLNFAFFLFFIVYHCFCTLYLKGILVNAFEGNIKQFPSYYYTALLPKAPTSKWSHGFWTGMRPIGRPDLGQAAVLDLEA